MGRALKVKEHHSLEELKRELRKAKAADYLRRVQCIIMRQEGLRPKEIQNRLYISRETYSQWIRRYNQEGLEGLKRKKRPEGSYIYKEKLFQELYEALKKNEGWWSVKKMQSFIAQKHGVVIPEETVRLRVKKAGFSWKSSRPSPYKGDKKKQSTFKKNFSKR